MAKKYNRFPSFSVYIHTKCNNLSAARNGLYYINIREDRLTIAGTTEFFCKFT